MKHSYARTVFSISTADYSPSKSQLLEYTILSMQLSECVCSELSACTHSSYMHIVTFLLLPTGTRLLARASP